MPASAPIGDMPLNDAMCQKPTWVRLLDHLVGDGE
jgi:hypothetical protein